MQLTYLADEFAFPPASPPAWSGRYARWSQLDAPAFLLPEAFDRWRLKLDSPPHQIFLASAGASNATDRAFTRAGGVSPTKFVHTLPNVRSSALLAVMGWSGPVFSLHRDPFTLATAFAEACRWSADGSVSWIWHGHENRVMLWAVGGMQQSSPAYEIEPRSAAGGASGTWDDLAIRRWFCDSSGVDSGGVLETAHWRVSRA